MADDKYLQILRRYWHYDDFRGIQRQIIESIGQGHDTLGLMPTGGGKSITFQVPALAQKGVCIVITPLIALMKDQVEHLRNRGIKAVAIHSGQTHQEVITALENCIFGDYKFLYVSPERIGTELFQQKVSHMRVSFICVDEAHCISQWGYDFRPAYLQIARIRLLCPTVPVLALTASATPEVVTDIQHQLQFHRENVFRMSFARPNLAYIVRRNVDKEDELRHILRHTPGSTIIYSRNRMQCRELCQHLCEEGFSATYYHAGLTHGEKDQRQQDWQHDRYRIMVATNAFGMGIDKPDVRLVIHMELPDSPEAYFQEAGRAGRDGQPAQAILLYNQRDHATLTRRISETYPDPDHIRLIYQHLGSFFQMAVGDGLNVTREFNIGLFCRNFRHFPVQVHNALEILTRAGYIDYVGEDEGSSRIMFIYRRDDLYRMHDDDPQRNIVLQSLLRTYTGLFADYVHIDEDLLGRHCGRTVQQVYQSLTELDRLGILSYIPRKHIPYITYTRRRVDSDQLVFPPDVYLHRRQQYERRIQAILQYAEQRDCCRSQYLLRYFGEESDGRCGVCDVCHDEQNQPLTNDLFRIIRREVLLLLTTQGPLSPEQISIPSCTNRNLIRQTLAHLAAEEEIITDPTGRIRVPN